MAYPLPQDVSQDIAAHGPNLSSMEEAAQRCHWTLAKNRVFDPKGSQSDFRATLNRYQQTCDCYIYVIGSLHLSLAYTLHVLLVVVWLEISYKNKRGR